MKKDHRLLTSKEYKERYFGTDEWNVHSYNAIKRFEYKNPPSYTSKPQAALDKEAWENQ